MRVAALVLGIVGGIAGIFGSSIAMIFFLATLGREADGSNVVMALIAFALSIAGMVAGSLAGRRRGRSVALFVVAALGVMVCVGWYALLTTPLFLGGAAVAALAGSTAARAQPAP